jgi:hypothetical protein
MDNRFMQQSKKAWTKSYADVNIKKWQQILSDRRAFTIIDSVEIRFKTQVLFNSVFGSMVSTYKSHNSEPDRNVCSISISTSIKCSRYRPRHELWGQK